MTENFEKKTTKTLAEHGKVLAEHGKVLAEHGEKLDKHQISLEKIVARSFELEDKIDKLDSKIDKVQDRILSAIDGVVKKNSDNEIEQVSTIAILDRHQNAIDSNKKEIIKIKKAVKLAQGGA